MPTHTESRMLPFTPEQLYALVADVEKYPQFLPWCRAARILKHEGENVFLAELLISFKGFSESYTSRVTLTPNEKIDVVMVQGPFHHLENRWHFQPTPEGTRIDFYLDFRFRSALLEKLIGGLFEKATHKMVAAFTDRAEKLYLSS